MEYIRQSLGDREEIIHVGQFHWMYTASAISNIVFGIIFSIIIIVFAIQMQPMVFGEDPLYQQLSWLSKVRELHPGVKLVSFFVLLLGLLRFAQMMIVKATTEIAITNHRLIYKRGLVARFVGEMSTDRIEGVNVIQGVLGRILNYGRVIVRGMGVGEVVLPPIDDPIKFRKAIEKARNL